MGLNASPSILTSTIQEHLAKYEESEPQIVKTVQDSLYVDDLCAGEFDDENGFLTRRQREFLVKVHST